MAVFQWSNAYQTGLEEVDLQHRQLVDMLNQLDEARTVGGDSQLILELLDGLSAYTRYHFSTEERLMADPGFATDEASRHQAEHQAFIEQVGQVQSSAHGDASLVSDTLIEFLTHWLAEHILGSDQRMATLLKHGGNPHRAGETATGMDAMIRALRESEARFRAMADHLPALIWMSDAGGRRTYFNLQWSSYTGLDREQLLLGDWREHLHPEDAKRIRKLHDGSGDGHIERVAEYRLRRADGRHRWFWETTVPRFHSDGAFAGEVGCAFDITERRQVEQLLRSAKQRLEAMVQERTTQLSEANRVLRQRYEQQQALTRELQQTQAQLLHSEKMAGIGQLAAGVAHEINNPLGYIHSNLSTLQGYSEQILGALQACAGLEALLPADDERRHRLQAAWRQIDLEFLREDMPQLIRESIEGTDKARTIVKHLKDFSRIDTQSAAPFDLEAGLDKALEILGPTSGINVCREYAGLEPLLCSGADLQQVFLQLLSNAVQALDHGGGITLRSGREDGDWIWLEVQDSGRGIPEQDINRLFEPFFTTRPVGEGTGMGLAVAYNIVNQHGGRIEVSSRLGTGSRFRVWLPLDTQTTKAPGTGKP